MELTRNFKQTVVERDPEFARALLDEEATLFLSGEPDHARYRTAAGALLWHGCTILAEPATELLFEDRRSGIEGQD